MQPYEKPYLDYQQQVELLKSRGLAIPDVASAALFLSQVSYYRFSAYALPYCQAKDRFRLDVSFTQLVRLYRLDEQLRERIDALLTVIEILLRTRITHYFGKEFGPFGHYVSGHFRDESKHREWMEGLAGEVERSHETFIAHYEVHYDGYPKLPIWMASEVMSMGRLSRLFAGLRKEVQSPLAREFGLQPRVLANWLHVLTVLRNICAHHGRLWNRELPVKPLLPDKDKLWSAVRVSNARVSVFLPLLEWLLRRGQLPLDGLAEIKAVMEEIATMNPVFGSHMGLTEIPASGIHFGSGEKP